MSTPTRKAKLAGGNTLTGTQIIDSLTASRAVVSGTGKELESSAVTTTELGYVSGVTSAIQTQINGRAAALEGGVTWTARDSARSWYGVASSSDGVKLVAVANSSQIYTSTDSGATWTARASNLVWYGVASSSDGAKLVAVVNNGQIYTSTDSGVNWTQQLGSAVAGWYGVASSSDGVKLVAVASSSQIYTSTDSGVNWTARDSSRAWRSVASSSDGVKLVAVVNSGQIYTSTDSGATWTARDSSRLWKSVASSSDGVKLVATAGESGVTTDWIYTSTDSGVTWTARDSARNWLGVASSSDGSSLAACVDNGFIYTSTDSGVTWTARDSLRQWRSVASSSDGSKLVAVVYSGQIYTATASEIATEAVGVGTDYTLTNSTARVDFGTTDAEVSLPVAGTYRVSALVAITNGATAADVYKAKFYNSTDAAAVASSERTVTGGAASEQIQIVLENIVTVTAAKTIQIYAYNATAARGTVIAAETSINYIRLI